MFKVCVAYSMLQNGAIAPRGQGITVGVLSRHNSVTATCVVRGASPGLYAC